MYYHVNLISKIIILIIFIHFIGKSGKRTSLILSGLFLLIVILRWMSHGKTLLPQTDLRGVITLHTHISKHGIKYNGYLPHIHLLMKTMWHSWKLQDIYQIFSQLSPLWSSDSWESDAVSITELQGVLFSVSSVWMRGSSGDRVAQMAHRHLKIQHEPSTWRREPANSFTEEASLLSVTDSQTRCMCRERN